MSCLEKVKDALPAKGEGLAGGMTVAHLQDLTGYSRSAVEQALRVWRPGRKRAR